MNVYKVQEESILDRIIIGALFIISVFALAFAPDVFMVEQVTYDCRMVSYPTAVDVPQSVIRECRNQLKDHHGN